MNPRSGGCTLCFIIDIKISFSYGVLLKDVKRQCNDNSIITNFFLQAIITININEYSYTLDTKYPSSFLKDSQYLETFWMYLQRLRRYDYIIIVSHVKLSGI